MTNDMKRQHKKNEKEQNIELFKLHFDINLSIRENKKKLESYGLIIVDTVANKIVEISSTSRT